MSLAPVNATTGLEPSEIVFAYSKTRSKLPLCSAGVVLVRCLPPCSVIPSFMCVACAFAMACWSRMRARSLPALVAAHVLASPAHCVVVVVHLAAATRWLASCATWLRSLPCRGSPCRFVCAARLVGLLAWGMVSVVLFISLPSRNDAPAPPCCLVPLVAQRAPAGIPRFHIFRFLCAAMAARVTISSVPVMVQCAAAVVQRRRAAAVVAGRGRTGPARARQILRGSLHPLSLGHHPSCLTSFFACGRSACVSCLLGCFERLLWCLWPVMDAVGEPPWLPMARSRMPRVRSCGRLRRWICTTCVSSTAQRTPGSSLRPRVMILPCLASALFLLDVALPFAVGYESICFPFLVSIPFRLPSFKPRLLSPASPFPHLSCVDVCLQRARRRQAPRPQCRPPRLLSPSATKNPRHRRRRGIL